MVAADYGRRPEFLGRGLFEKKKEGFLAEIRADGTDGTRFL